MNFDNNIDEILKLLKEYFKNDTDKVSIWLSTNNKLLGGVSPYYMMVIGRDKKLLDFIKSSIEGNYSV